MTPRLHFADVRGASLAWNSTGDGPPVVWAHGLSSSAYGNEHAGQFDWRPISARHRLIRVNARAHGRSSGGLDPQEYTWPELAQDLIGVLGAVDGLGPTPIAGVGASMGSATLLYAALAAPQRFSRLVLTCPPVMWSARAAQMPARLQVADLVERAGLGAIPTVTTADLPLALADTKITPPRVSARRYPAVLRGAARSDLPAAQVLGAIDIPVLLLSWTDDPGHPVESGELLADALPNARLQVAATPTELREWPRLAADFLG